LAEVRIQLGESLENALRRFKRKVQQEDIIKEVKRHSYYLKPGERRRAKQALARKRARKKEPQRFVWLGKREGLTGLRLALFEVYLPSAGCFLRIRAAHSAG
jgi:small subunit ribosomal protein S21